MIPIDELTNKQENYILEKSRDERRYKNETTWNSYACERKG